MSSIPPPPPPPVPPPPPPFGPQPAYGPQPYGQQSYGQQPYGQQPYGFGYGAPPYGASAGVYAGFWARLGAQIIDGLIGVLFAIPAAVLFVAALAAGHDHTCTTVNSENGIRVGDGLCRGLNVPLLLLAILAAIVAFVAFYWFLVTRLGRTGQTPGRKIAGVRVVDRVTGQPIGAGRAVGRYAFAMFISGQVCYLGYLWALWEPQKRTWHDMIVNSVVVRA
jgi:uncharacterized RDD family membrane protein YckC